VEITSKRVTGGNVSVYLNERASVGMTVEASGPFGQFCFEEGEHRDIVLLAAGSGITPMIAMLRYIDDLCLDTQVTLLYCVRSRGDVIFGDELERLGARLKKFSYHLMASRAEVTTEFIGGKTGSVASKDFFLCGPLGFMESCKTALAGLGVPSARIYQESFGAGGSAAGPETTAEFVRSGKSCVVRSGQTLLSAAEENGVPIPSMCRAGQCGTCKTRLLSGQVIMDVEVGLDPASKAAEFVLTCVGRAEGPVKLDA
jgi:ferredoxin-NADP reductase